MISMFRQIIFFIVLFLLLCFNKGSDVWAQDSGLSKLQVSGYLNNLQTAYFEDIKQPWMTSNELHDRLNVFWYPSGWLTGSVQFRSRFIYGGMVQNTPGYGASLGRDMGLVDMSFNLANEKAFVLNSTIDRLYLQATAGKLEFTAGRQRINWGQAFVWNPNDLFNTYSFFDFDYPERPGADALRLQYYTSMTSKVEAAVKADSAGRITAAGLVRFNLWNYDFQFLGGILNSDDYAAGFGFSGNIKGAGFRGEAGYYRPVKNFSDTSATFLLTLSGDYTFSNSLYIQAEGLLAEMPGQAAINNFMDFYSAPLSAKNLAFTKWNLFARATYPVSPLLNVTLSGMYFPAIDGIFAGPQLDYSLTDNFDVSFYLQLFSGKFPEGVSGENTRQNFNLGFLRFSWNY